MPRSNCAGRRAPWSATAVSSNDTSMHVDVVGVQASQRTSRFYLPGMRRIPADAVLSAFERDLGCDHGLVGRPFQCAANRPLPSGRNRASARHQ